MAIFLIAGGTGLVGTALSIFLKNQGHTVRILSRNPKGENAFFWNPSLQEMDVNALKYANCIVNLAGAGIADKRWTKKRKEEIISSRVLSNQTFLKFLSILPSEQLPASFISAAAVGYYGDIDGNTLVDEESPAGPEGFLAESCIAWEKSIASLSGIKPMRLAWMRIGVVLSKDGGAMPKLTAPMRFGIAPYFRWGKSWMSWISIQDLCRMVLFISENEIEGPINAVSPNPLNSIDFTRALKAITNPWAILIPVPTWPLKIFLGEMHAVVTQSARVSAKKIMNIGFKFKDETIQ
jgi:uncharacterized protein